MGAAVGKVVSAFIDGMVMPAVGMLTGGVDFSKMKHVLKPGVDAVTEVKDAGGAVTRAAVPAIEEVAVKYGAFITQIVEFLIVAFVAFMVLKTVNNMKKKYFVTRRNAIITGLTTLGGILLTGCAKKSPPTYGNILRMAFALKLP